MVRETMRYTLEPPATEADWQAFHDIREAVLWTARGKTGYSRRHADDYDVPQNQPLLLKLDGQPIGVMRFDDLGDGTGCIRLVAIAAAEQGRGHGRVLAGLWDDLARGRGIHLLVVNAAIEAVGFYERLGWEHHEWDRAEHEAAAGSSTQMRKRL